MTLPVVGAVLVLDEVTRGPSGVREALPASTVDSSGSTDRAVGGSSRERGAEAPVQRGRRPDPPVERTVVMTLGGVRDEWTTSEARVGDVLDELGIELGPHDVVIPDRDEPVTNRMEVVVQRVEVIEEVERRNLPAGVVERRTDERTDGDRAVVRHGRDGWHETVFEVRVVDGFETDRAVVAESVEAPLDRVVEVGTAPEPEPERAPDPEPEPEPERAPDPEPEAEPETAPTSGSEDVSEDVWDRLAQCEAGGDWAAATGNGYFGGLQLHPDTWAAHGGRQYADNAHEATREQQIVVGERVHAEQGWAAWPTCARRMGLR